MGRRRSFHANLILRVGQLAALVQAGFGVFTGARIITRQLSITHLGSGVSYGNVSQSTATGYGVTVIVVATVVALAALLVTRPSTIARWLVGLYEAVALGFTLAAYAGGGSVLGGVTVIVMAAGGVAVIPVVAVMGMQAGIAYALAVHPPTYSDFHAE
ncbi:MAG: hypothetical protein ACREN2_10015 [Candidatus Dormibacteria bacterium]